MFFELVLHWEYPLPAPDSCQLCRNLEPLDLTKSVVCDRCESIYHLQCLDPPLSRVPKGDWVCSFCVEQRCVAVLHPNKIALVAHPTNTSEVGQVISIEQENKKLSKIIICLTLQKY